METLRINQMLITFSFHFRFWGRSKQFIRIIKLEFNSSKWKQTALTQGVLERKSRCVCHDVLVHRTQYNSNLQLIIDPCACTLWHGLQSSTKVLVHLAISVREFISSSSSAQFNVVYRDEVVIVRLQHCLGEKGDAYSSDVIRYWPPNTLSTYFRVIWSSVPRTLVVDCSLE